VIATIPVHEQPCALVYNPTNNKIYCANYGHGTVTLIDGATNITGPNFSVGACISLTYNAANNKIYCAHYGNNTIPVIRAATNLVVVIYVDDGPLTFAWNSTQNRTYVANYLGSSISVIRDTMIGINEDAGYTIHDATYDLSISPNPFTKLTQIRYSIPNGVDSRQQIAVNMKIYDVTGRLVRSYNQVSSIQNQASAISWYGDDDAGRKLPNGVYFLKFVSGDYQETEKVLLAR
jgi:hypothetical protein